MKPLNLAVASVLLLGLATSCKPAPTPTPVPPTATPLPPTPTLPPESIRIAILGPLSGNVKPFGEASRDGALLAIEEWNERGGVLGLPIEAVVRDCVFNDMQATAEVTTKIIEEDKVRFIIGGIAHDAIIMSRIANPRKVLHISASSPDYPVTVDEEGKNKPYSFRAVPLDAFMAEAMAAFAVEELGAHTAGVLYNEENDIETHYAGWFRDGFQERGGVVNRIAEQAKEKGIRATLLGSDAWDVSPQLDLKLLEDSYYWSRYSPVDTRDIVRDFIAAYKGKYGIEPDAYAALAYDAANILLQAIAEAGMADPERVKDTTTHLKFEGVTGEGTFDEFGDLIKKVAVIKIEGGRRVFYEFVLP